jgi:sensor histidine kinase regulating citrate/malate metabolism
MPNGGKLTVTVSKENNAAVNSGGYGGWHSRRGENQIFQSLMTPKSKGQGFGLVVTKRLVETLGGTISFESQVGVGTTFKIIFPTDSS